MTINEIALEIYRDDHADGAVWNDLTDVTKAVYRDAAQELLENE